MIVRESILFEKFEETSDPIEDLGIGEEVVKDLAEKILRFKAMCYLTSKYQVNSIKIDEKTNKIILKFSKLTFESKKDYINSFNSALEESKLNEYVFPGKLKKSFIDYYLSRNYYIYDIKPEYYDLFKKVKKYLVIEKRYGTIA